MPNTGFRVKDYETKNDPKWPKLIDVLAKTDISTLDLGACQIDSKATELYSCAIGNNPISPCKNLKILNLSRNLVKLDGAKTLAAALKQNTSIEFLDLSSNQLKVFGMTQIAAALHGNTVLKGINLFKNTLDVDGARAIRGLLEKNSTLEFIDLGHNRIRSKGLEAIREGILANPKCNLHSLGLRMNFINDEGFDAFFNEVVFDNKVKRTLRNLYITENNLTLYKARKIYDELMDDEDSKLYVDAFEKMHLMKEEKLKKTLWFGPIGDHYASYSRQDIINQIC
jgi:Ran GTPase-activating protein (RanGAP) involved in mRNA processing and transport